MGPSPQVPLETEPGRRTPRSPGERALLGLVAGTALVTVVIVLLNLVGGDETAILPSPSPTLTSEQPATPTAEPSAPRASEVPFPSESFPPVGSASPNPTPPPDSDPWLLEAQHHRGQDGQVFSYDCPANGQAAAISVDPPFVWGTDVYTDDSLVCLAAVHAGVITFASGGTVSIEMLTGQDSYLSTERNGVLTRRYGEWYSSYEFVP